MTSALSCSLGPGPPSVRWGVFWEVCYFPAGQQQRAAHPSYLGNSSPFLFILLLSLHSVSVNIWCCCKNPKTLMVASQPFLGCLRLSWPCWKVVHHPKRGGVITGPLQKWTGSVPPLSFNACSVCCTDGDTPGGGGAPPPLHPLRAREHRLGCTVHPFNGWMEQNGPLYIYNSA